MTTATKKTTKRSRKNSEPPSGSCSFPGCRQPPVQGVDFCAAHWCIDQLSDSARRSMQRGQLLEGFMAAAGNLLLRNFDAALQTPRGPLYGTPPHAPPPRPQPDPWATLGLDPTTATRSDIRRVQRQLAAIYHTDKAGGGIAAAKIAEINAAAEACLKLVHH